MAVQLSSQTTLLHKFNTDLELLLGLLNHSWSGISTVFHPIQGFSPRLIAGLLLSNITGNAPYPDDSASSVSLVPMLRKEPFSAYTSSYLKEYLNSSRSLADLLPPNLWSDCCVPTCCFPLLRGWSFALSTAVMFPVTLCMAATFACFSFLLGAHQNGKAD